MDLNDLTGPRPADVIAMRLDDLRGGALAARIRAFQFRDIRPKAASELPLDHTSRLPGHAEHEITEKVHRRIGEAVKPTR